MRNIILRLFVSCCLLGMLLVLVLIISSHDPFASFHSDPNRIRPWAVKDWEYVHDIDPSTNPLDSRYDMGYTLRSLEETSPGEWRGNAYVSNGSPEYYDGDFEPVLMTDQTLINGKTVRFEMTGQSVFSRKTLLGEFDPQEDWYQFRLNFFHPDGRAYDPDLLRKWYTPSEHHYFGQTVLNRGRFYGFSSLITYPQDKEIILGPRYVFDPRTKVLLQSTSGGRTVSGAKYASTQLPLLTGEKALISQEIFYGPVMKTVLADPQSKDEVSSPYFRAQLIFIGPGEPGNYGHFSGQGQRTVRFGGKRKRKSHSNLAIVFSPPNTRSRLEILAVDSQGKQVPLRHRSSSFGDTRFVVEMPREDIQELQFCYRTGAKRLLIDVPLFSISEENRGVKDLFDARVPLVVIRNENHWRSLIADLTQLRTWHNTEMNQLPEETFPIVFENKTVRELLVEYHKLRPDLKIRLDDEEQTLKFGGDYWSQWWNERKRWFRNFRVRFLP